MTKSSADTNKKTNQEELPKWDLSDLYPSPDDSKVKQDIELSKQLAESFKTKFTGKVKDLPANELANAIIEYEKLEEILGKLSSYAQLLYAANMTDPKVAQFYQNISETVTDISSEVIFFTLEINKIEEKQLDKLISESDGLRKYSPWLQNIRAYKKHQLPDEIEKILHDKSITGRTAWSRLFDETIANMNFPLEGKKLSAAEIFDKLSDKNETIRKKAAKSIGKEFGKQIHIFTLITNTLAKDKDIEDKWRKFQQPISSRNLANQVEDEVVETLINSVKENYKNISHRYYAKKAKWFGKKKLNYWDRNAPLPMQDDKIYSWDEAKEIVLESYKVFSPKLAEIAVDFFNNDWIDVGVRKGKDSGAFAHPTVPSAHPYLLLNYQGKTRDVMTLAHELGHGVHQILSAEQGALMADTPLTLAETASVFGEQLVFQNILESETNAERRQCLIAEKVEDMLNTVIRQVAFCEFERIVHNERKTGELTTQRIGEIWQKVQSESLGSAIRFSPEYQYYWSYIPHFIHSPFYVYAYAFGDCLVNALYAKYKSEKAAGRKCEFEQKYIDMLRAGGSKRHKELLKPFGIDISKPDFWQQGLDIIANYIDEL